MYWKLVDEVEYDALEGNFMFSTSRIIGVIMARNKKEAEQWFSVLMNHGVFPKTTLKVLESNEEEYDAFLDSAFN